MRSIEKLASLAHPIATAAQVEPLGASSRHAELAHLLSIANGLYCFESALHVLPSGGEPMSLERWNAADLWRDAYGGLASGLYFFAEDIFGNQFAIQNDRIVTFDAETGAIEEIAATMEGWAKRILADHEHLSGFHIAHKWQVQNGQIPAGCRLVATIPFVLGGEFAVENFRALEAVKAMRWRGDLATQIRDLPDGARVELKVI